MKRLMLVALGTLLVQPLAPVASAHDVGSPTSRTTGAWASVVLPEPASADDQAMAGALVTGVAAGPDSVVAVGQRVCRPTRGRTWAPCWGVAWTSPDGVSWSAADPMSSGLDLGHFEPVLSGPEIGLEGVAYGPAGFLAYGRVERSKGGQVPAVWRSDDGVSWARLTSDDTFAEGARLRTMLGAEDGYLLGGVIYGRVPRAAIWSSADGVTWRPGRRTEGEDHVFDIGGYIDTMEDPLSGGINAFAAHPGAAAASGSLADGIIGVGQACAPALEQEPWAWNGACEAASWASADGLAWQRTDLARTRGPSTAAASDGHRLVVAAPVCWHEGCASVVTVSDDGVSSDVAYGTPVGGEVRALAAEGGRFRAVVAAPEAFPMGPATLAVWTSDDGTNWKLDQVQPSMPLGAMWLHDVDVTVLGDRLLVVASGTGGANTTAGSIALLSPPLARR